MNDCDATIPFFARTGWEACVTGTPPATREKATSREGIRNTRMDCFLRGDVPGILSGRSRGGRWWRKDRGVYPRIVRPLRTALVASLLLWHAFPAEAQTATPPAAGVWLRLEALPAEMKLTPRESFDGVPTRFTLLTDGYVFLGGRRAVVSGALLRAEMQEISTALDLALKALGKAAPPQTLALGEGPAVFRFAALAGTPLQIVVTGDLNAPTPKAPTSQLVEFIRRLANFRHPSLKAWDPEHF